MRPNISSHSKLQVQSFLICQCKENFRTKRNLCNLKWSHNRYFKIINFEMKPSYRLEILYVPFIRYGFIEQSFQKHSKKAKKRQKSSINGAFSDLYYARAIVRTAYSILWESARTLIFICYQPLQLFTSLLVD